MPKTKTAKKKKFFTPEEANAMLPLVRVIVRDIRDLYKDLCERQERLQGLRGDKKSLAPAYRDEIEQMEASLQEDVDRLNEYGKELQELGIELKDPGKGLIDFPGRINNREVYLCWCHGEETVSHWHELHAGFSGRQKLPRSGEKPKGTEKS